MTFSSSAGDCFSAEFYLALWIFDIIVYSRNLCLRRAVSESSELRPLCLSKHFNSSLQGTVRFGLLSRTFELESFEWG